MKLVIQIYRWTISLSIMLVTGTIALSLVLLSFGFLRNFCSQYLLKYSSRLILSLLGYTYDLPDSSELPNNKILYTFNHPSYLDVFLLTSLGLPNCRYFLSEKVIKYIPLTISALALGTFFIPQQFYKKRRLAFLIKYSNFFKNNSLSLFASSEGVNDMCNGIYSFNRGIYHLAKEAGMTVVLLYIHIPREINPGNGYYSKSGHIKVEVIGKVEPQNWNLKNLDIEILKVRDIYVNKYKVINNGNNQ